MDDSIETFDAEKAKGNLFFTLVVACSCCFSMP